MSTPADEALLQRELRECAGLGDWVRAQLYGVRKGGSRATAATAVAAAAAEEAYRLSDELPELQNETSRLWRGHLQRVWQLLAGDATQHYPLSRAVADYLTSPLNHIDGQDGPDDFDRPQIIASYSACLCAVAWGVDFAETAVMQLFDCLDVKYDGELAPERWRDVTNEIAFVHRTVDAVVFAARSGPQLPEDVLTVIRR